MNAKYFAKLLLEGPDVVAPKTGSGLDHKIEVLNDRMLLQIMSVPSLLSYFVDAAVLKNKDGSATLQFGFLKLPEEALDQVKKLLSTDYFEKSRFVQYIKNSQAMVGLEIDVEPDDLPGKEMDYAF